MKKIILLGFLILSAQVSYAEATGCPKGMTPSSGPLNNRPAGKQTCEDIEKLISEFKKECAVGMWKDCHSMCLLETDPNRLKPIEKNCDQTLIEVCNMKIDDESCKLLKQRKHSKK